MRAVLTCWLTLGLQLGASAQPDPGEVARRIHAHGGYGDSLRFENGAGGSAVFPDLDGPGSEAPDGVRRYTPRGGDSELDERARADDARTRAPRSSPSFSIPTGGGALSRLLLIVSIVVLVVVIIALLIAARPGRKDERAPERPAERPAGDEEADALPWDIGDADALAEAGRYREAILALLVSSLKGVGWVPDGQRSRTAREILWDVRPDDTRRLPLTEVVGGAERVRFGGVEPSRELYEQLRRSRDLVLGGAP